MEKAPRQLGVPGSTPGGRKTMAEKPSRRSSSRATTYAANAGGNYMEPKVPGLQRPGRPARVDSSRQSIGLGGNPGRFPIFVAAQ
jgi:hypothetical protein